MEMSDAAEKEKGIEKRKEVAQCDFDAQHAANYRAYPKPLAKYEDVVADPEIFKETLMKLHVDMGTKFMAWLRWLAHGGNSKSDRGRFLGFHHLMIKKARVMC